MKALQKIKQNELVQRAFYEKTPRFWKKVGLVGACITGVGTLIVSLPLSLPVGIVSIGTYLITAGGTLTGISVFAKESKEQEVVR
jgi:uncharacterized membrane protein HdeD (DUF308 family)